jgi:general stress protein 26
MNKLGRYSESFLEDYKENIQKAWIPERESFFAQQKMNPGTRIIFCSAKKVKQRSGWISG